MMPRGPRLKTLIKKEKKLAEAKILGEELGKTKADKKKPLDQLIKEYAEKLIDKIDPLELASLLATTYVIHGIILNTTELFERATNITKGLSLISGTPEIVQALPFGNTPFGWTANIPFLLARIWDIWNLKENVSEETKEQIVEGAKKILEKPDTDSFYLWVLSFSIAYYIQKHGIPDIFGSIKAFLGIAPV